MEAWLRLGICSFVHPMVLSLDVDVEDPRFVPGDDVVEIQVLLLLALKQFIGNFNTALLVSGRKYVWNPVAQLPHLPDPVKMLADSLPGA